MEPACAAATDVLALMKDLSERTEPATVRWTAGQVVIIDNWRALHGREAIPPSDECRLLLRVVVHDKASPTCF
jgi:alpha-ketoglutarate-dependent taurine dioxygenase